MTPWSLHPPTRPAGYGNTGPQRCWVAAWMICVQTILNLLLNAVLLGIIFAKVANPRWGCLQGLLGGRRAPGAPTHFHLSTPTLSFPFALPTPPRYRRYRAYSIYISDSACVSRRDGILKLLFRVADVRRTQAGVKKRVVLAGLVVFPHGHGCLRCELRWLEGAGTGSGH